MNRLFALPFCLLATQVMAAPAAVKERQILLDVQPAAAPVPALKYQLLPEVVEQNPGNVVPAYLKCFAEQNHFFFKKESVEEREKLRTCPLSDIKPGSLKNYGGAALKQADHAARLEYCDWNTLPQMREHGFALLLPEIQQMRSLATALEVRCRGQIVDKDFDGAVHTLKTLFAMARHVGDHPTLISGLVGAAIANLGLNLVEELIQQPGVPNLYWALTGLPAQIVDPRRGVSGERMISEATFGTLADARRTWSPDDVAAATRKFTEMGTLMAVRDDDLRAMGDWLRDRVQDEPWLAAARKGLTAAGYPADVVRRYPAEQVIFQAIYRKTREAHDEAAKWIPVPYWQAEAALAEIQKGPANVEEKLSRFLLVFNAQKVKASHLRTEQRLALLRVVEAIRLDAAKNGGKLPASLTNLSSPIPIDPASGKAFGYRVDGMTTILEGKAFGKNKYAYEVRLRK